MTDTAIRVPFRTQALLTFPGTLSTAGCGLVTVRGRRHHHGEPPPREPIRRH